MIQEAMMGTEIDDILKGYAMNDASINLTPCFDNPSVTDSVKGRKQILKQAMNIVCKDRESDYGSPENNFATIARLWSAYCVKFNVVFTVQDVAAMMILMKCARLAANSDKADTWVDIAGYAACGGSLCKESTDDEC